MPSRKIDFLPGEFYHIYNRGNSKQAIFFDEKDYEKFAKYLYLCNTKKDINFRNDIVDNKIDTYDFDREELIVSIGAWVLMPNHFHLYLTIPDPPPLSPSPGLGERGGNCISKFVSKLSIAYVSYLNKKYERTGSLFEEPFKAKHIKNDNQARYLFSYIHLNPVKLIDSGWKERGIKNTNKTLDFLNTYKWSSYLDYKNDNRPQNKILDTSAFPEYFQKGGDFEREILSWLKYGEED